MKDRFYFACFRENVGGNMGFHGTNGRGYGTDIDKAQVLTRAEAQMKWDTAREYDQPVSADHIDALAIWKVDMQYIPSQTQLTPGHTRWVGFMRGRYSGNDVYWLTDTGTSVDFSRAKILHPDKVDASDERVVYLPFEVADKAKRRTVDYAKLNRRTMIQGAGLVTPEHVRRERRRKANPMTRMNCPSCGKIHWQHNPHDFEGCNDRFCDETRWPG